jgi:hypothetical protein
VWPRDYVAEHLELGYATTVHRAQGRTVDTAHAFVNATTHREGLYVATTRGRESNRLYVDTLYEPDEQTAHGLPEMLPAGDVLRRVLANRGAEMSATEAIEAGRREQHGLAQVLAEYNTLAAVALRERYDDLMSHGSGLSDEQVARVQEAASYGALLAALRQAENQGVDVDARFPSLVTCRTLDDAEDLAAVLHERVELSMSTAVETGPERERICGLFPKAPPVRDPDMSRALEEREALIEQSVREVATEGIRQSQPWLEPLGAPPTDPNRLERWTRCAETVAAYRERWGITGRHVLGVSESMSLEQESQRRLAQRAVDQARRIHRQDQQSVGAPVQIGDRRVNREGVER